MSHSLLKAYIHFVWNTKYQERLLDGDARTKVRQHISEYAESNKIRIEAIAVRPEHVHMLVLINGNQTIEDIAKLIKGETSHWINQNDIIKPKFSWQTGYAAFSVSYQGAEKVKRYIDTQDEHHKQKLFVQEYTEMLKQHGYSDAEILELLGAQNR